MKTAGVKFDFSSSIIGTGLKQLMVAESQDATESASDIYTDITMQITGLVTISLIKWKPVLIVFTLVISNVVTAVISNLCKLTVPHYLINHNTPMVILRTKITKIIVDLKNSSRI